VIGYLVGALAVRLTVAAHRLGTHVYLSTGCLHGQHDYCRSNTGLSELCETSCACRCHRDQP
jgi:hypothetical protein